MTTCREKSWATKSYAMGIIRCDRGPYVQSNNVEAGENVSFFFPLSFREPLIKMDSQAGTQHE